MAGIKGMKHYPKELKLRAIEMFLEEGKTYNQIKEEALQRFEILSFKKTKEVIDQYIHFYNYERIQLKTRQTPYQIRCLSM